MAEEQTVVSFFAEMKDAWGQEDGLRAVVPQELLNQEPAVFAGERHGSWFLEVRWTAGELSRSAAVALSPPGAVPEGDATSAVLTVRSAASSDQRFVVETMYERNRALSRITLGDVETLFVAALTRAAEYSDRSLTMSYDTGER